MSAGRVDGVSAGLVEAGQHLTGTGTVEEQAGTALGLGRGVVVEVIGEAG